MIPAFHSAFCIALQNNAEVSRTGRREPSREGSTERIRVFHATRASDRRGFTLLEVLLSLSLTAVVAILIGGLIQLFLLNETRGRESVRQAQMARAILNMIAEDIRTSVRYYPYDTSGLQQMLAGATSGATGGALAGLTGGGGGGAGPFGGGGAGPVGGGGAGPVGGGGAGPVGGAGGSTAPVGAGGAGPIGGGAAGGFASGASGGGGMSAGGVASGNGGGASGTSGGTGGDSAATPVLPPGIFGSENSIEIDVSRLPRPDEYVIQPGDVSRGTLGDMPSDIKTVGYFVQTPNANGVLDPLASLTSQIANGSTADTGGMSGGLVRRSLDRAVTQYAYQMGQTDQLARTGEIIAPEILGIEFSYFKGASGWQTSWDSTGNGLPDVVKVTIAMQSEGKARTNPMTPGLTLSTVTAAMAQEYGLQLYSINVIIPGANLLTAPPAPSGTGTSSNGMSSVGL